MEIIISSKWYKKYKTTSHCKRDKNNSWTLFWAVNESVAFYSIHAAYIKKKQLKFI